MKWLFVISVALVACGRHDVKQLERARDQVCACKDVPCAEAALATVPHKDVKSTPRSQKLAREMLDCLAKLYEEQRLPGDDEAPTATETAEPGSAAPAPLTGSATP